MLIFRNRIAAFLWGFALVFMLFLSAMTYVLFRDGAPDDYSPLFMQAVLLCFWLAGLSLSVYAANKPCLKIAVQPGNTVIVTWYYPFKIEWQKFLCTAIKPAVVIESEDDEHNPYFHTRFTLPDNQTVDLAENHNKAYCEQKCAEFNAALVTSPND